MARFLISQKPKIVIPYDFKNQESIVFCEDDLSDLLEKCAYDLKHSATRESIAKNAYEHVLEYHTDLARAEYILDKIHALPLKGKGYVQV